MDQARTDPLRIASYNIRAGLGTDLRRDPERVLQAIAGLKADLVALQEADFRLGQRPTALPRDRITEATGLTPLPVAANDVSIGWHGIALLAKPEIVLTDIHRIDLPGLEPRGAVIADLSTSDAGALRVIAVHLGLMRSSRRRQIDHIREVTDRLAARPTVILGDFNEWSGRKGLGRLTRDYRLADPVRTYPARSPVAALDRMAHCTALELRPLPVPATTHPHPSDHRPLLAEMHAAS